MVGLSLPLIQEGQLSVCSERICTSTGQLLRKLNLPRKSVVKQADRLNMTNNGLTAVKPQFKLKKNSVLVMLSGSLYIIIFLLGRLSPQNLCIFYCQKLTLALLE